MYAMLNKWIFSTGAFFQQFTLVCAIITVGGKLSVFYKDSKYPVFSILLFKSNASLGVISSKYITNS